MVPQYFSTKNRNKILLFQIEKMKLWNLNGLKTKQIKLFIIIFFTGFIVWGWERAPRSSILILKPDPLSIFHPADPKFVQQHPASDEDFPNEETFPQPVNKHEKIHALSPFDSGLALSSQPFETINNTETSRNKKGCNYGKGEWVEDSKHPLYSGFGCKRFLSEGWACRLTQRPDFSYEKFRWKPQGCEMPDFDANSFLQRMQNNTIAYVGDSLGRQMFQSMMCMLAADVSTDIIDIGEKFGFIQPPASKRPNGWAYNFPLTNTTILYYWSSTLCDLEPIKKSDPLTRFAMHLDRPPAFLKENLRKFDVLVVNTGHHWNRGKINGNKWDMYVNGKPNNDKKLALIWKAKNYTIHSVVKWLDNELVNLPNIRVFLRTISPRHFFNGDWDSGGRCDNNNPLSKGNLVISEFSEDSDAEGAVRGTRVRLLDITGLSRLRDEGHISKYSINNAVKGIQDCLHWCLPGVPDTWNEILAAQV